MMNSGPCTPTASCGVGFVCAARGGPRHEIVRMAIEAVENLTHRGAVGADGRTGDGAGVLFQVPEAFFWQELKKLGCSLPPPGSLAVGVFFLFDRVEDEIERIIAAQGPAILAWRDVPTNDAALGASAIRARPRIRQLMIDASGLPAAQRSVRLFLARRAIEQALGSRVYVPSLSTGVIAYKGMLVAPHLSGFYPDLRDPAVASSFCLFHQRFSTNTSPDWTLAQPFRMLAHNGEINTLQGNRNWMAVLEHLIGHPAFGEQAALLRPLVSGDESDSASLDRIVELLVLSGLPPEHAVTLCIPPAWEHAELPPPVRAFFEYNSLLMKPWDGPAAVVFTDGESVGAHMDRNGLRPLRYTRTTDGLLIVGSETGMIDLAGRTIEEQGRLGPGETLAVNVRTGAVRFTEEIVSTLAAGRPYEAWMRQHLRGPARTAAAPLPDKDLARQQVAFGYTAEEIRLSLREMASSAREFVYSMGDDTPLPPLSNRPQLLFRYFKQRFSQVTNPAIDPIRERMVMSLTLNMGRKRNFLVPTEDHARRFGLESPVLTQDQLTDIEARSGRLLKRLPITYETSGPTLEHAVDALRREACSAVREGAGTIVLSDADLSQDRVAIPSLLALSAVYQALTQARLADRASVIVETGEARDTHHFACLVGYGASAVHPWLAFRTIAELCSSGIVPLPAGQAMLNYARAVDDGLLKVIARLGISTLNAYHAAQLFDAVCLNRDFLSAYFSGTPASVEADGIAEIEASVLLRHAAAFGPEKAEPGFGGELKHRKDGEFHAWAMPLIAALNRFLKSGDEAAYREYARSAGERPVYLRHLLGYRAGTAVPLDEVEPEEVVLKRFVAGAMSVGALSPEAHETIAEACNRLGIKSNSGEGGEDPRRVSGPKNSAMKQIASGRFGVTPAYLASATDLEIKIAQGAKPGEGGHLPREKVTDGIARLRHCSPNTLLISPPPHHDIYSIEDLSQLIHDLKQANPAAHVCVKLVAEAGCGTVAAGVAKAYGDIVQISGCEGGTGAAGISSIKNAGSYWEPGIAEAQRTLMENGLRDRVRLRVDGGFRTGRDVVIAALLGAEEFGFGTATMIAAGCVMARQCHANTCPTGIATQDPKLRRRFRGTPEHIISFFRAVAQEVRRILASMGMRSLAEIIGRNDLLEAMPQPAGSGSSRIRLAPFFEPYPADRPRACACGRNDNPAPSFNDELARDLLAFIEQARPVERQYEIRNIHRSIPVRLSYHIARLYGDEGLPPGTIRLTFRGTAGQSFGAFNHRGMSLTLFGDANDYAGKGMYGGVIALVHADGNRRRRHVIAGNTALYGATGGEFFAAGMAGERFAVRNSGATAVIEGAGLHLCEYMTRGTVAVIGPVGGNIGAGMTGGVIYVLDEKDSLGSRINASSVRIADLDEQDAALLRAMLERHQQAASSVRAAEVLSAFDALINRFRKVLPV